MKKVLLFILMHACVMLAVAQTDVYSGKLTVKGGLVINTTMNDVPLSLTKVSDDVYSLEIKNFSISLADSEFNVGNINIPELKVTANGEGFDLLSTPSGEENNILLSAGDDPNVDWLGPDLGGAQGTVTGKLSGENIELAIPLTVKIGIRVTLDIKYYGVKVSSGISTVTAEDDVNTPEYTPSGQRVTSSYRGIVIRNGKKYVKVGEK